MKTILMLLFLTSITHAETTSFPEPMVFDLVRGLDNKKGEFEANVLTFTDDGKHFNTSPEVEFSVMDGLAFELETPMLDNKIEALKFAAQYTFYDARPDLLSGVQLIYEKFLHETREDLTLVNVTDYSFNSRWSTVVIAGMRNAIINHKSHHGVVIMNISLFYQLNRSLFLGIENDKNFYFINKEAHISSIPQVSWKINPRLRLQTGVGVDWEDGNKMSSYFRMIGEF